jgi:hypothetical protein
MSSVIFPFSWAVGLTEEGSKEILLIVNRQILPSFENRKKVYELHTIFQKTDGKLRR